VSGLVKTPANVCVELMAQTEWRRKRCTYGSPPFRINLLSEERCTLILDVICKRKPYVSVRKRDSLFEIWRAPRIVSVKRIKQLSPSICLITRLFTRSILSRFSPSATLEIIPIHRRPQTSMLNPSKTMRGNQEHTREINKRQIDDIVSGQIQTNYVRREL
jgi:hypothetical protein